MGDGAEPAVEGMGKGCYLEGRHRVAQVEGNLPLAVGQDEYRVPVERLGEVGATLGVVAMGMDVGIFADDDWRQGRQERLDLVSELAVQGRHRASCREPPRPHQTTGSSSSAEARLL